MTAKKTTAKKSKPVNPKKRRGGSKATGKGNGPGGARSSALDQLLSESLEEVEDYFRGLYDDETYTDECTVLEKQFALAYMDNGFKIGPAYLAAVPSYESKSTTQRYNRGKSVLSRPGVQKFVAQELYNRQIASGVTRGWVTRKYREWASIDPTEFFEMMKLGKSNRYSIVLKCELTELPKHVRTAIKSMSVDPKSGSIKVELVDQKGALDQLSKLLGFTNDNLINLDTDEVHLHFDKQDADA